MGLLTHVIRLSPMRESSRGPFLCVFGRGSSVLLPYSRIPAQPLCGSAARTVYHWRREFLRPRFLEVPIIGASEFFSWGVWVSLSEEDFERMSEMWEVAGRESEPAYHGSMATDLPFYPDTASLNVALHTRPIGQRQFTSRLNRPIILLPWSRGTALQQNGRDTWRKCLSTRPRLQVYRTTRSQSAFHGGGSFGHDSLAQEMC